MEGLFCLEEERQMEVHTVITCISTCRIILYHSVNCHSYILSMHSSSAITTVCLTLLLSSYSLRKMEECKKSLEANLFILHNKLRPALLVVRGQCEIHCESKLMAAIEPKTTYTLDEFKTCHITKMKLVRCLCVKHTYYM